MGTLPAFFPVEEENQPVWFHNADPVNASNLALFQGGGITG